MGKNSETGVKQFGTSIPYVCWHQHGPMAVSGREGISLPVILEGSRYRYEYLQTRLEIRARNTVDEGSPIVHAMIYSSVIPA